MEVKHGVVPQTPEQMERDTLGTIARVCADMERCAMEQDADGLMIHYDFLCTTMRRLNLIRKDIRRHR